MERNKGAILQALRRILDDAPSHLTDDVRELSLLELGSGTGEHAVHFARTLKQWRYYPSDVSHDALRSINAHAAEAGLSNLTPAQHIDLSTSDWNVTPMHAAFCANVIHISPPAVTEGLISGVGRCLVSGGPFLLYGPFSFEGVLRPESNVRFDEWLKSRDPSFGVRAKEEVADIAEAHRLQLEEVLPMPANNHCLVFRKQ